MTTLVNLAPNSEHYKFLIKHSTNAIVKDKDRRTPLHLLLQSCRPDAGLALLLIKHGTNVTA
jgi:hypothetical protein